MMRYERYNAKRSERDVTTARVAPKGPQIVHSRRAYVCDGHCHPALTLPSLLSGQEPRSVSDRLRDFQTFFVKHEIGAGPNKCGAQANTIGEPQSASYLKSRVHKSCTALASSGVPEKLPKIAVLKGG
jgi:hypothetical protein